MTTATQPTTGVLSTANVTGDNSEYDGSCRPPNQPSHHSVTPDPRATAARAAWAARSGERGSAIRYHNNPATAVASPTACGCSNNPRGDADTKPRPVRGRPISLRLTAAGRVARSDRPRGQGAPATSR